MPAACPRKSSVARAPRVSVPERRRRGVRPGHLHRRWARARRREGEAGRGTGSPRRRRAHPSRSARHGPEAGRPHPVAAPASAAERWMISATCSARRSEASRRGGSPPRPSPAALRTTSPPDRRTPRSRRWCNPAPRRLARGSEGAREGREDRDARGGDVVVDPCPGSRTRARPPTGRSRSLRGRAAARRDRSRRTRAHAEPDRAFPTAATTSTPFDTA